MKRVLVQAGHLAPLETGHKRKGAPGEVELVTKIRDVLVRLLRTDGRFEAIPVPGDIPDGVRVDAALFLHANSNVNPRATGFSFGYPISKQDVRLVAGSKRLADLIATEFKRIPGSPKRRARDNDTPDSAGYYGFRKAKASEAACLIEHGFVSNAAERAWLNSHVGELALAEYVAVCRLFRLEPRLREADDDEVVEVDVIEALPEIKGR